MTEKLNAAENLQRKHELLAKEYSKQNKDFKVKHEAVKKEEQDRISKVEESFGAHHAKIREQMDEEQKEMVDENGVYLIDKETDEMEEKYKELLAEIDEKRKLFKDQGKERKDTKTKILEQMKETISSQKVMISSEIEQLKKAVEEKKKEDVQLKDMVKEYREKFKEFSNSLRMSKQAYNKHERSIEILEKEIRDLTNKKRVGMLEKAKEMGLTSRVEVANVNNEEGGGNKKNKKKKNTNKLSKDQEDDLIE